MCDECGNVGSLIVLECVCVIVVVEFDKVLGWESVLRVKV